MSAFSEALPKHIHPTTRRIHPNYWQLGAATGRMSCSNPNLQQIPRSDDFRRCFVPAPKHKIIVADYSQIELRVAAEISNDQTMIKAYQEGKDLHALTASLVTGKPLGAITKDERQQAKAVNFGLTFGMGAKGLQSYARNSYGVEMTEHQAETFRNRFFEAYKGIAEWHGKVRNNPSRVTRTLGGRRRLWVAEVAKLTARLNTPVQGSAGDILKKAMAMLPQALDGTGARIIGTVHDEIILEVPEERDKGVAHILKKTMEEAGGYYLKKVPVKVEVSTADSWAEK